MERRRRSLDLFFPKVVGGLLKMKRGEGVWIFFSAWWAFGRGLGGGGRRGLRIFFKHVGYRVWMGVGFLFPSKRMEPWGWTVDVISLLQRNSDLSIRHSWMVNLDLGFLDRFV
jgi:hypothetical protein